MATSTASCGVVDVRQEHGELVAAEPGDHVAGAQRALDPLRDDLEQPVADLVAEGVVDLLEPVEVEEEQRERLAAAGALLEGAVEGPEQELAVRAAR